MRIGIICPSEIAYRRFMPALTQCSDLEFAGIGVCTKEERFGDGTEDVSVMDTVLKEEYRKAQQFIDQYGGKLFEGYQSVVTSKEVDAVYIPLPPALHFSWAYQALEQGKHVLVEKPATISGKDTKTLVELARSKGLALHENYMFVFHKQLDAIDDIITSGEIGAVRLYRISFGFPRRDVHDFRYRKSLGGGALLDAGGYTLRYADRLLGGTAKIQYAQLNTTEEFEVDINGSAALVNEQGVTAQIAFGMDHSYKCELEVWASKGCLVTGRVLTAPAGFVPKVLIRKGQEEEIRELPTDDSFQKSINHFWNCICDEECRQRNYRMILRQAHLVEEFKRMSHFGAEEG